MRPAPVTRLITCSRMARTLLDGCAEALPMRMMTKAILAGALILALAGCETANTPTYPTMFESGAGASVSTAASAQAQPTTFTFCPTVTPFTTTIGVVVVAGTVNVNVTNITAQFTDVNSVVLPAVTFPAPIPIAQFGSDLVRAQSSSTFPVTVNFGCGTASTGTVTMVVHLVDANGVETVRTLTVPVR